MATFLNDEFCGKWGKFKGCYSNNICKGHSLLRYIRLELIRLKFVLHYSLSVISLIPLEGDKVVVRAG